MSNITTPAVPIFADSFDVIGECAPLITEGNCMQAAGGFNAKIECLLFACIHTVLLTTYLDKAEEMTSCGEFGTVEARVMFYRVTTFTVQNECGGQFSVRGAQPLPINKANFVRNPETGEWDEVEQPADAGDTAGEGAGGGI